jgi:DNA polymerase-3 subunit alpha
LTDIKKSNLKFVNFHGHTTFSIFDGMGYPEEHVDFAYQNGLQGTAFTEHGNQNSFSYAFEKDKKIRKEGKDFRIIYGIEAYVHPSTEQWQIEKDRIADEKITKSDDEDAGMVVEDETETKRGIKSTLNRRSHLVLVAQNQTGLNNLFKLTTKSYKGNNFYRFPRMDYAMLKEHSEGVIASTACLGGVLANDYWNNIENGRPAVFAAMEKSLKALLDIFGDRLYGELQWGNYAEQHIVNQMIIELCNQYGVKLISTCDSHFPSPDMWKDREIYKMLGWLGKRKGDDLTLDKLPSNMDEMSYQLYPKNGDELFGYYRKFAQAQGFKYDDNLIADSIERTHDIMKNRIENFTPNSDIKLPSFVVPEGESADSALAKVVVEKMRQTALYKNKEYVDRVKEELYTIKDRGFSKYFLTMKTISDEASSMQIVGAGRGSGAGSLVSYLCGITQIDPIKYKLQFSRFIRKNASDYPDIDYDVSDPMVIKEKFIEKYGENCVVPISNYNTLQVRSLIKDISKLYGVPFQEVNNVTAKMLKEAIPKAKEKHPDHSGVYNPTFEELKEYSETLQDYLDSYPEVATHIENLHGQIRSISRHAGGVLFADNLDQVMPLINSGGVTQTPWTEGQTVRHLEPLGFIKFDVLGLASLRMLENAISHILRRHHGMKNPKFKHIKKWYNDNLHPEKLNLDDQKVYENIFHAGKFCGTFQFTAAGAQKFCQRAQPRSILDIAAITSIYRPGPLKANVDKKYVDAKNNPENIEYMHPVVEEVLKDTYGYLIFQEQLSMLAHKLGNDISLDEGNELRKVLTKKGTGKEAQVKAKLHDKFVNGCTDKGLTVKQADELWQNMEYFSGYGFNLSHAVCYSILSYQCAWLWNYYPAEWACAFLDKEPEKRKEQAIGLVKSYGFNVKRLDVNKSSRDWEIDEDGKTLIQPLSSIKGLGDAAISEILEYRPFKTVEELLFHEEMSYSKVNKKALDALCRGGALSDLVDDRYTGLKHFWSANVVDRPKTMKKFLTNIEKYAPEKDFSVDEVIDNMVSLIGIYPISLVMDNNLLRRLSDKAVPPIGLVSNNGIDPDEDDDLYEVDSDAVWFIPREVTIKTSKNNKKFWVLKVTDSSSAISTMKVWAVKDSDKIYLNRPYMARIKKDDWGISAFGPSNLKLLA